jgi:hypothetical protein
LFENLSEKELSYSQMKKQMIVVLFCVTFLSFSATAQTFRFADYYQLKDGNSWNYVAPPAWKGDYISLMETGNELQFEGKNYVTVSHFDATKAAKILAFVKGKGIIYFGENFADETFVRFDKPQIWFPEKIEIGTETNIETPFTRTLIDGKIIRGTYKLKQKVTSLEDVKVTSGQYKKCLRIESESFWDLGDGRRARTISIYHYAKNVGVVKASARFIILNSDNKETINRLIETNLKSAKVGNKSF